MIIFSYIFFFFIWRQNSVFCDSSGDVNLVVIFSNCTENTVEFRQNRNDSASWIIDRLNVLGSVQNLKIGLEIHNACEDREYFDILFGIFKTKNAKYVLGIVTDKKVTPDVKKVADILGVNIKNIAPNPRFLLKSAVQLLEKLGWTQNLTVIAPTKKLVDEFFKLSRLKLICVKKSFLYENISIHDFDGDDGYFIIIGENHHIVSLMSTNGFPQDFQAILVPTDGSVINGISEDTYVILPSQIPLTDSLENVNVTPSPFLFEIAQPILSYTEFLRTFLLIHCNQTRYKLNCLRYKNPKFSDSFTHYTNEMILKILKIEPLKNNFVYDVYRSENASSDFDIGIDSKQPLTKIFTYNIFDDSISSLSNVENGNFTRSLCSENAVECEKSCENFNGMVHIKKDMDVLLVHHTLVFRSETWVLAFLIISVIGVVLSLIIIAFFFVYICRKDVLEGNPITTIFLLLTVLLMYCSVLLFSIELNPSNENFICLLRTLWTTLSVCGAFSLILSRCILLSTVTKEIAYMSHIPGSVQSFLTLFIFGIQAALSLQVWENCHKIFEGVAFLNLMSYNIMLLLLILCICPVVYKSQRNYKEGKFFTISAVLITLCWCFWIACYKVLDDSWKDLLICFAMVSTASILQGVVFVSRTYLMITSASKNKLRNNLPTLGARNEVLDIYRSDERRVYDCVDIAALNAISVARAGIAASEFDGDIYNYPTLPRDEELNFEIQTNSSSQTDKVTRF